jgi:thymidylate kinase
MHERVKKAKVLCLIGGDGTGKSTHAKRIVNDLGKKGKKSIYVWFGQPYIFSYPVMFIFNRLGFTKNHKLANNIVCNEHQYFKSKAISFIWPWIQLLDLAILTLSKVDFPAGNGKNVVCDRFVYDTLVELMVDTNDGALYKKTVGKLIISLKPKNAMVVRLDIDSALAFSRRDDVPNLHFLKVRRQYYDVISKSLSVKTVDAARPFDVVSSEIGDIFSIQSI